MTYRSGTWFYPDEGRFLTIWSLLGAPIKAGAAYAALLGGMCRWSSVPGTCSRRAPLGARRRQAER
jgi:hypothetical protein